jgi:hypothetical protein
MLHDRASTVEQNQSMQNATIPTTSSGQISCSKASEKSTGSSIFKLAIERDLHVPAVQIYKRICFHMVGLEVKNNFDEVSRTRKCSHWNQAESNRSNT